MKRRTVSISQAKAGLSELVHGVAFAGEEVVIAWHGKPRARLVPVAGPRRSAQAEGILAGLRMGEGLSRRIAARLKATGRVMRPAAEELAELRRARTDQIDR